MGTAVYRATRMAMPALVLLGVLTPHGTNAATAYTYDQLGRVTTAVYDNGMCVAYSYDANGNRTAQTNSLSGTSATWGSGVWGCFHWTASP